MRVVRVDQARENLRGEPGRREVETDLANADVVERLHALGRRVHTVRVDPLVVVRVGLVEVPDELEEPVEPRGEQRLASDPRERVELVLHEAEVELQLAVPLEPDPEERDLRVPVLVDLRLTNTWRDRAELAIQVALVADVEDGPLPPSAGLATLGELAAPRRTVAETGDVETFGLRLERLDLLEDLVTLELERFVDEDVAFDAAANERLDVATKRRLIHLEGPDELRDEVLDRPIRWGRLDEREHLRADGVGLEVGTLER